MSNLTSISDWTATLTSVSALLVSIVCFVWLIRERRASKRVGFIAENLHDQLVTIQDTATAVHEHVDAVADALRSEISAVATTSTRTTKMGHFTVAYREPPLRSSRLAAEGAAEYLLAQFGYHVWRIEWSDFDRSMELYCHQSAGSHTEDPQ